MWHILHLLHVSTCMCAPIIFLCIKNYYVIMYSNYYMLANYLFELAMHALEILIDWFCSMCV